MIYERTSWFIAILSRIASLTRYTHSLSPSRRSLICPPSLTIRPLRWSSSSAAAPPELACMADDGYLDDDGILLDRLDADTDTRPGPALADAMRSRAPLHFLLLITVDASSILSHPLFRARRRPLHWVPGLARLADTLASNPFFYSPTDLYLYYLGTVSQRHRVHGLTTANLYPLDTGIATHSYLLPDLCFFRCPQRFRLILYSHVLWIGRLITVSAHRCAATTTFLPLSLLFCTCMAPQDIRSSSPPQARPGRARTSVMCRSTPRSDRATKHYWPNGRGHTRVSGLARGWAARQAGSAGVLLGRTSLLLQGNGSVALLSSPQVVTMAAGWRLCFPVVVRGRFGAVQLVLSVPDHQGMLSRPSSPLASLTCPPTAHSSANYLPMLRLPTLPVQRPPIHPYLPTTYSPTTRYAHL